MKYLYKILRLFFCPHKLRTIHSINIMDPEQSNETPVALKLIGKCDYCGTIKVFTV